VLQFLDWPPLSLEPSAGQTDESRFSVAGVQLGIVTVAPNVGNAYSSDNGCPISSAVFSSSSSSRTNAQRLLATQAFRPFWSLISYQYGTSSVIGCTSPFESTARIWAVESASLRALACATRISHSAAQRSIAGDKQNTHKANLTKRMAVPPIFVCYFL